MVTNSSSIKMFTKSIKSKGKLHVGNNPDNFKVTVPKTKNINNPFDKQFDKENKELEMDP